ncbi:MAG: hypothetical protein HYS07_10805 [Chlamydiae bacterium]|nr:hypothetical protein [Chlamydiota bacterium]
MKRKIPRSLQRVLWSYDIHKMDLDTSRELIIQQVLNHGDWKELQWLYKNYSEDEIRLVISHPRRGVWFPQVLNFWLKMLDVKLPKKTKGRALFSLEPRMDLY